MSKNVHDKRRSSETFLSLMATQGDKNKASLVRNVDANPSSIVKFKKFPKCFLP